MDSQEAPYAGLLQRLSNTTNSNEARLKLLERRLTGELPSPRSLTFDGHLRQSDLDDVSSSRVPGTPVSAWASDNGAEVTADAQLCSKKRKFSDDLVDQRRQPARSSPFQQVTNRGHVTSPAKHSPHRKSPVLTSPLSSRLLQRNTINKYFPNRGDNSADGKVPVSTCTQTDTSFQEQEYTLQGHLLTALRKAEEAQQRAASLEEQLQSRTESLTQLQEQCTSVQQHLNASKELAAARDSEVKAAVAHLAKIAAVSEMQLQTLRLQAEGNRIGQLGVASNGIMGLHEVWEDGQAFKDWHARMKDLAESKAGIEAARKSVRRQLPPPEGPCQASTLGGHPPRASPCSSLATTANRAPPKPPAHCIAPEQYVAADEIFKARLAALKREEEWLHKEQERLEADKAQHIRQLKRVRDQEKSRFRHHDVLHGRYLLMNLLGKGGFSEVFKAFDLQDLREVAVKLHQLSNSWSDVKKASYVKHAVREYKIHRQLRHPRVVGLLDIFELDSCTFATVLELCEGSDLDLHLHRHQVLPEKEAKAIASQIFDGLAYLNGPSRRIIHYDLKPANILFNQLGEVKITDFGLSKIVEEDQSTSMELTSQGAGTYWYLPPECFEVGAHPPTISNKVDVWSAGVMLYQMLFGKRPFGEGCTQEKILRDEVMLNAKTVAFPSKPNVSAEGKDFISRCLAHRQQDRFDVHAAAAHPYLQLKRPTRGSTPADKA
ncbi:hypothetical protein ABBQ32_002684 [Trebouxia sp. C0010 RCD-2024]